MPLLPIKSYAHTAHKFLCSNRPYILTQTVQKYSAQTAHISYAQRPITIPMLLCSCRPYSPTALTFNPITAFQIHIPTAIMQSCFIRSLTTAGIIRRHREGRPSPSPRGSASVG